MDEAKEVLACVDVSDPNAESESSSSLRACYNKVNQSDKTPIWEQCSMGKVHQCQCLGASLAEVNFRLLLLVERQWADPMKRTWCVYTVVVIENRDISQDRITNHRNVLDPSFYMHGCFSTVQTRGAQVHLAPRENMHVLIRTIPLTPATFK
jgi:hypothetical protein